jgi:heat shock protein HtpX
MPACDIIRLVFMPLSKVDIRPRRSMLFFAVLAIVMVVSSYLFVIVLAAACVYLPYLIVDSGSANFQVLALFLGGIVMAAAMLWSLVPRHDKFVAPGMPLSRQDQPRLFTELDDIAASLNERLPSEVYLIPEANAFVADRGGVMGFGSRRVMGLGLPLFSALSVSQFRAVLAHEFAHYYGGDTSLGPWVYRTKMAIVRIFKNVGSLRPLTRVALIRVMYMVVSSVLQAYFKLFLRAINLVSRRQEYRADELACLVAGREPLIGGLRAIHGAALAWPFYWRSEVAPMVGGGALPAIGDGFARFLAVPQINDAVSNSLQKTLQEATTAPYDTHPPLRDRIAATENLLALPSQQNARPASTLLDHLPDLELHFVEDRISDIKPGTLTYVSWDDVALKVTIPSWQKAVAAQASFLKDVTAESIPAQIPKFADIGSHIPDPKGMLLSPDQRTQRAGQIFATALVLALIENGWTLTVQPGLFRLRSGADDLNPFQVVADLMANKRTPAEWVGQCKSLGISHLPLDPAERTALAHPAALSVQPTLFDSPSSRQPCQNCETIKSGKSDRSPQ